MYRKLYIFQKSQSSNPLKIKEKTHKTLNNLQQSHTTNGLVTEITNATCSNRPVDVTVHLDAEKSSKNKTKHYRQPPKHNTAHVHHHRQQWLSKTVYRRLSFSFSDRIMNHDCETGVSSCL